MVMDEYTRGPRPSLAEAIRGVCFQCTCSFLDGHVDCRHRVCEVYSRMPYKKLVPKVGWLIRKEKRKFKSGDKIIVEESTTWSAKYINKIDELGISLLDYVTKYMVRNGKLRIPMRDIVRAYCFRCNANYYQEGNEKGRIECELRNCPFYWWTPYRQLRPLYDWMFELRHTMKHVNALVELGVSREEYIEGEMWLSGGSQTTDDDSDDEEENEEENVDNS